MQSTTLPLANLLPGLCLSLRFAGDFSLAAATPVLIYKLRKNGAAGISVETQILRLVMSVTRYLDLFVFGQIVSQYNTYMKIFITVTSLHVVASLIFRHKAYSFTDLQNGIYRLGLPLLSAMLLAPVFTYQQTFVEISWAFSIILGISADIPQLVLYLNPENRDWKMNTYIALIAGYRAFYIPHWVVRYLNTGTVDPVASLAGICEATIFAVTFFAILWSNCRRKDGKLQGPEDGILTVKNGSCIPEVTFSTQVSIPVDVKVSEPAQA